MLQRYVPDFKIIPGETYQVHRGGKIIDFVIDQGFEKLYLEWHAFKLGSVKSAKFSDFESEKEAQLFWENLEELSPTKQKNIKEKKLEEMCALYHAQRATAIHQDDPQGSLHVIYSPKQLYSFLENNIWPNGLVNDRGETVGRALPELKRFCRDFKTLKNKSVMVPRSQLFEYLREAQLPLSIEEFVA